MWRPSDLSREDLPLPEGVDRDEAAALADLETGPLSAVVQLGGCTGAFVSDEGLVVTAYHCLWDALRSASAEGENLIDSGFHAATREEERWGGPAFTARRTVAMTDVTEDVLARTEGLDPAARAERITRNTSRLVRRCESRGHRCEVEQFDATSWVLVEQEVLSDLRLVFTPPRDVGYFGGDADNWRWPRHSGDFAFFRVYADKNNRSGEHAEDNVPYRPPSHLEMGPGPTPDTPVAVAGYPARTWRYMGAPQLEVVATEQLPYELDLSKQVLAIYNRVAIQNPSLFPKLQPPRLAIQNQRTYLQGGITSLQRAQALDLRWHRDRSLERWIMGSVERTEKWGPVVEDLRNLAAEAAAHTKQDALFDQFRRSALLEAAMRVERWARQSQKPATQRESGFREADRSDIAAWLDELGVRYHEAIDRPVLRHLLSSALELPKEQRIPELDAWFEGLPHEGSTEERLEAELDALYDDTDTLLGDSRGADLLEMDPDALDDENGWFGLAAALVDYSERRDEDRQVLDARWAEVQPRYMAALQEFLTERYSGSQPFYSEANGTLRVTFGTVEGYEPEDGLIAEPRTTLAGMRRKAHADPYHLPEHVLEKSARGPHSRWADPELEDVPVNFLSTADTTVGSSGSPTFTLDGRWVGLVFDGNFEGMGTDWAFDPEITRSIHTDASYVLWYLTDIAEAYPLLEELGVRDDDE